MLRKQAGKSMEMPPSPAQTALEHEKSEIVRQVYQVIQQSSLDKFTFTFIDSVYTDLTVLLNELDRLPEAAFMKLIEVIDSLREARKEMRLARFLFDVEEVPPVYRLMMRNRAVLRGECMLHNALRAWPLYSSSEKLYGLEGKERL